MQEHDTTIEIIRKDYVDQISNWLMNKPENQKNWDHFVEFDLMDQLTILQMRALVKRFTVYNESPITILGLNPRDPYLAINQNGIYIGIEPDGYTHS